MMTQKYIPPKGAEEPIKKTKDTVSLLLAKKGQRITASVPSAIIRAEIESKISYAAGYPGAPTADLIDLLSESGSIIKDMGIFFESSTNEASAATKLLASVYDRISGFVNWKVVGTNVVADVLAHITASGTVGASVIVVGEDYETDGTTVEIKSYMYGNMLGLKQNCIIGSEL